MTSILPIFRFVRVEDIYPDAGTIDNATTVRGISQSSTQDVTDIHNSSVYLSRVIGDSHPTTSQSSYTVRNCSRSSIVVDIPVAGLYLYDLQSCQIVFSCVRGSVNIGQSQACSVEGFCGQLRLTDCEDTRINVQVKSRTALVNCRNMTVGPPAEVDANTRECMKSLDMDDIKYITSDRWQDVDDFDLVGDRKRNWVLVDSR